MSDLGCPIIQNRNGGELFKKYGWKGERQCGTKEKQTKLKETTALKPKGQGNECNGAFTWLSVWGMVTHVKLTLQSGGI
jgi:hypothetical protein